MLSQQLYVGCLSATGRGERAGRCPHMLDLHDDASEVRWVDVRGQIAYPPSLTLAAPEHPYLTGAQLVIDGGKTAHA